MCSCVSGSASVMMAHMDDLDDNDKDNVAMPNRTNSRALTSTPISNSAYVRTVAATSVCIELPAWPIVTPLPGNGAACGLPFLFAHEQHGTLYEVAGSTGKP